MKKQAQNGETSDCHSSEPASTNTSNTNLNPFINHPKTLSLNVKDLPELHLP